MSTNKRLLSNFLSLSSVQVGNYILPLITIPYLVRVLGPEKFGLIAFAQAFIGYFTLLTDYGFNLSATRIVSINRDNKGKLSDIFCSVVFIKISFLVISFLIVCILVFSLSKFRDDWLLYLLTFSMILGNVFFPVWFFQGMERMKQIALLNIIAKIIFTASVFIFIKSQNDYIYLPLINSLGFIIAGLISLWIVIAKIKIRIKIPSINEVKYQLKEGWHIFISTLAISLYTVSNTFILGFFVNSTIVGYYSAGEKIINAVQGLFIPVSQTVYPYINKLASESRERALSFIRRLILLVGNGSFIISLVIFIFAVPIVNIILGKQYQQSIIILKILAFLPFIVFLTNMLGAQLLLPFDIKKLFTLSIIIPSISHILLLFLIAPSHKEIGVAGLVIFTESAILIYRISGLYLFHRELFLKICYGEK